MGEYRTQIDLRGQRFERLVVLGPLPKLNKFARWACQCDCGQLCATISVNLRSGVTRSCGCFRRDLQLKHGHNRRGARSRAYNSWTAMRTRCQDEGSHKWENYGARGISVCFEWESFEKFLADMGCPPRGMTLDRIDVNGNYEPSNCRWATAGQQARNKQKKNKTGFMGVCAHELSGLFNARIGQGNKTKSLGYFKTAEEAHSAYLRAVEEEL